MSVKFLSIPDKRLSETIGASATSFKVSDILGWDDVNLSASDFGTVQYVAFRNSANTEMELMEIDPATIASASITINKRGLKFDGNLTTEVSGNKKIWVKGDTIVSFGSNPPQLYQYLKEYIDAVVLTGMINASTTQQGAVEIPTQAEVYARTATGGTGAILTVTPATLPSVLVHDYAADTGSANAYAIAPTPAITAYVAGQQFTFKAANANTTTSTLAVNGLAAKTIKKLGNTTNLVANDILANQIVTVEYDGTDFQMLSPIGNAPALSSSFKFGGTGADGALSISSGATNIDCANAKVVVKNYTSISITGTGSLTFSNPATNGTIVILKSQGAVTLTSSTAPMIAMQSMGADQNTPGGNAGYFNTVGGTQGSASSTAGGTGQLKYSDFSIKSKLIPVFCGAGGAQGGGAGTGGRGGGGLYIECGGALNFTTSAGISVAGANASDGANENGGGGAGGSCIILYNTLTANSGTITVAGGRGGGGSGGVGTGGAGGDGTGGTGTGGSGGGSGGLSYGSGGGGSGFNAANGSNGASGSHGRGGGGASGLSLVAANTEFV